MPTYFNKELLRIEDYKDWLANTKFTKCGVFPPPKNKGNEHWLAI